MKPQIKLLLLISIIGSCILYMLFAFVKADLNFVNWEVDVRGMFAVLEVIFLLVACMIVAVNIDETKNKY